MIIADTDMIPDFNFVKVLMGLYRGIFTEYFVTEFSDESNTAITIEVCRFPVIAVVFIGPGHSFRILGFQGKKFFLSLFLGDFLADKDLTGKAAA